MLQTIREHTQGWIAGIIIGIIILTFALWGVHSYFVGGSANNYIAEVNGVEITKDQFNISYERLRRQAQSQYTTTGNTTLPRDESALKAHAMQSLIDMEVLKQASLKQGYLVSDRQINIYLQSLPEFQVDGQFSLDRFQEILANTMLSTSEFLELIRTSLLIDQPKLGVVFSSFSLPDETVSTIALVNQERDIDYISIPTQYFISQPIVISADRIKQYYDQNKSDFMTPEQVNIEYVELSLKNLMSKFNPTDNILKTFYNENINSYTQPTRWKIISMEFPVAANATVDQMKQVVQKGDLAYKALKAGGDFTKIAKQYAAYSGNPAWMSLTEAPADYQKSIATLLKSGDVSEPFKTAKGLVILKAVEVQEPKMLSFDAVKDKVRETYIRQHAEEKFTDLRDQLADLTYEHPDSLELAAKNLNLPIQTTELFEKTKGGKDISQYKKVRDIAFSNDVLNLQNNSDVIQTTPDSIVVLRLKSHVASALLPLNQVSAQIEQKLKAQEAESRADKFSQDLLSRLQTGADPKQLAATFKLKWNSTGLIGRYSNKIDTAILDAAFSLPNPANAGNKPSYGVTRLPNGYGVVAVKSVKSGVIANPKQAAVYAEQIQNSEGLLEYELYKQSQIAKAKVKVNTPAA